MTSTRFILSAAAAKEWANRRGIHGKQGSTYLYVDDVIGLTGGKELVQVTLYRPYFSRYRAVQGYGDLARHLLKTGDIVEEFGGYFLAEDLTTEVSS